MSRNRPPALAQSNCEVAKISIASGGQRGWPPLDTSIRWLDVVAARQAFLNVAPGVWRHGHGLAKSGKMYMLL